MPGWPFDDSQAVVSLTVRQVMDGTQPILLVCRDPEDGMWQFLTGGPFKMDDALFVSLVRVFAVDPTIGDLADLPLGWSAERAAVTQPWARQEPEDEELA